MVLARSMNAFHEQCTPGDASHDLLGPSVSREALPSGIHKISRGIRAVTRHGGAHASSGDGGVRGGGSRTYTGSEDILVGVVVVGVRWCESVWRRR